MKKKERYQKVYCTNCGTKKIVTSHGEQIDVFRSSYSSANGKQFFEIWLVCPNYRWWNWFNDCDSPKVFAYLYKEEYEKALKEL